MVFHFSVLRLWLCQYIVTTLYNIATTLSQACDLVTRSLKHVHHLVHCKQPCHNLRSYNFVISIRDVTLSHLRSKGVSVVEIWCTTATTLQVHYNFPSYNFLVKYGTISHWNPYSYATHFTSSYVVMITQTNYIILL